VSRTAVVLFAGDPRREEVQKGLPARFLARLHDRLTRTIRRFDVDLFIADDIAVGSLAHKIDHAFAIPFARGYERVIVLAGDIVLRPSILQRAIESSETLIGRTCDGGFYILACSERPRIDWTSLTSDDVAAQLDCGFLPQLRDVDSINDARIVAPDLIPRIEQRPRNRATPQPAQPLNQLRAPPRAA